MSRAAVARAPAAFVAPLPKFHPVPTRPVFEPVASGPFGYGALPAMAQPQLAPLPAAE